MSGSEWGAHSLEEIGIGLAITLPVSVAYGYLWVRIGAKLELTEDLHGSPKYLNHANIVGSGLLVPLAYIAWWYSGEPLGFEYPLDTNSTGYLQKQWLPGDSKQWFDEFLCYAFILHFFKDIMIGVAPLLVLHHIVSIASGVLFLSVGPPGLYLWGGANLLLGDILQCYALLCPNSMPVWRVNFYVNTVTNFIGLWCGYILFIVPGTPTSVRWSFGAAAWLFSAIRQFELVNMFAETKERLSRDAAGSTGADVELNAS